MLISHTILVKFQLFKENFSKTIRDTRLTFLVITDIAMLFNSSKILLVYPKTDKQNMLMKQK